MVVEIEREEKTEEKKVDPCSPYSARTLGPIFPEIEIRPWEKQDNKYLAPIVD